MKQNLTDEQKQILDDFNQSSIVSAGAGSGKTMIMIELILKCLKFGIRIENVLALTYTNLAAGEMKQRLMSKLMDFSIENKRIDVLEQIDYLPQADISTFHSFYEKIVKKYFYVINVSPSFEIISDQQLLAIKEIAFNKAVEKLKQDSVEKYLDLLDVMGKRRSNKSIKEKVFKLDNFLSSQFDKNKFLREDCFSLYKNFDETLSSFFSEAYSYCFKTQKTLENLLLQAKIFGEECLCEHINECLSLLENFVGQDFLEGYNSLSHNFKFPVLKESKKLPKTETFEKVKIAKQIFGDYLKIFRRKNFGDFQDIKNSFASCEKNICSIIQVYQDYKAFLGFEKQKLNMFDFSDLEEFCYQILQNETVRNEVKAKYKKIYVDEFQDINPIQNAILNLISNNNVFYVGDPKQSIYAFRQADVDIIVNTLKNFEKNDQKKVHKLTYNFRSNPEILKFVNLVFKKLMTEELSQIDYEKDGKFNVENEIVANSKISCNSPSVKIIGCIEADEEKVLPQEVYEIKNAVKTFGPVSKEAQEICNQISNLITEKITDKDGNEREIQFKDIAILVRKRSEIISSLTKAFKVANIPFDVSDEIDLLSSKENQLVINLIKLSLNKNNDLSFAPVIASKLFSFSYNELAQISQTDGKFFYEKCWNYIGKNKDEISEKLSDFYSSLDYFRFLISTEGISRAVLKFFEFRNFIESILKSENGFNKLNILKQFLSHIKEADFDFDLLGLVQYLSKIEQIKVPSIKSANENCVKITTIHSSKGLEFPIVILADCGRDLFANRREGTDFKIDKNLGIAIKNYDNTKRKIYDSIFEEIISMTQKRKEIAENLRLLYVGLTRAQNKLIITGKISGETVFDGIDQIDGKTDLITIKQNYMNLLLGALVGENNSFYEILLAKDVNKKNIVFPEKFEINKLKNVEKFLNYSYPNLERTSFSSKTSVSLIAFDGGGYENVVDTPQSYENFNHLSFNALEEGNVVHEIMEKVDFNSNSLELDILKLIKEINSPFFKKDELLKIIKKNVNLIKEIVPKNNVNYKEKEFIIYDSPFNIFAHGRKEKILIQGKIDFFSVGEKNILIDYKYTSIKSESKLVEKYLGQLKAYKFAIEQATNIIVGEVYLLSLKQGKLIPIKI